MQVVRLCRVFGIGAGPLNTLCAHTFGRKILPAGLLNYILGLGEGQI
jgi:hypothetical protein